MTKEQFVGREDELARLNAERVLGWSFYSQGTDATRKTELRKAAEEFAGHGLALSLLGTYLRDVCEGDVQRRGEVPLLDEGIEQGGHARRVMASYESWLGQSPELQLLYLVARSGVEVPRGALELL